MISCSNIKPVESRGCAALVSSNVDPFRYLLLSPPRDDRFS